MYIGGEEIPSSSPSLEVNDAILDEMYNVLADPRTVKRAWGASPLYIEDEMRKFKSMRKANDVGISDGKSRSSS